MAEKPKPPTLRKVNAGGIAAGVGTLVTAIAGDMLTSGHLSLDTRHALVALVAALIVWGASHGVMWLLKETHALEYAEAVWSGAETGVEWTEDLRSSDPADDGEDDGPDPDDGEGVDEESEPAELLEPDDGPEPGQHQ